MRYDKEHTRELIFPIGGIGTGSVGFAGNGMLKDWEIFNRPAKGSLNGCSHLALRMKTADGVRVKILNGDQEKDLMGQYGTHYDYDGYGYGPNSSTMAGYDHFSEWSFTGEFPMSELALSDPGFPAEVTVAAWNPMIPNDSENSSIPAAFFDLSVTNTGDVPADLTVAFTLRNPFPVSKNTLLPEGNGVFLKNAGVPEDSTDYGDLTLTAEGASVRCVADWYRGGWHDGAATYWREINSRAGLQPRSYGSNGAYDTCTVSAERHAEAGETVTFRFLMTWNVPNNYNYWNPLKDEAGKDIGWKNWYATRWADSRASNAYASGKRNELKARTLKFKEALFATTADPAVLDAASSTLSVLHTPTVLRLEDGSFYGWEGCREVDGSCEGSCTHVWNYAYALCYLFPDLERSMRDLDFKYNLQKSGAMRFRLTLPVGREGGWPMPCVDGQMGGVIKLYRDWKLCGDTEWLRKNWPAAKRSLEFAWSPENPLGWDADKDGVLEGRQHHTLDMELFGPSSWLQSLYMAALSAGAEMASFLGETASADEYRSLVEKASEWTENHLFNGSYYVQKLDLSDYAILDRYADAMSSLNSEDVRGTYWNPEVNELKYQIGEGCEIDQCLGEWHAVLSGLPPVFDPAHLNSALDAVMKNNYRASFRGFTNPWRNFILNDESGTMMCAYPEGARKPAIPVPYCEETMHGFEYAFAGLLLAKGHRADALKVVRGVRDRYDGRKRNPYNEIECGNNYARSMASFALLMIDSGFFFDLPNRTIGFDPQPDLLGTDFTSFWSLDGAWGTVRVRPDLSTEIRVLEGALRVSRIRVPYMPAPEAVLVNGEPVIYSFEDGMLVIDVNLSTKGAVDIRILRALV